MNPRAYHGRNPGDERVRRSIRQYDSIRADRASLTDGYRAEKLCTRTQQHIVFDDRVARPVRCACAAEGHAVVDENIVADDRRLADHDAHSVVDEDPTADGGAGVDLDAGQEPGELRNEPRQNLQLISLPQSVRQPVRPERVHAGIPEQYFGTRPCSGVTPQGGGEVFAEATEEAERLRRLR